MDFEKYKIKNRKNIIENNLKNHFLPSRIKRIINKIKTDNLTYLSEKKLKKLANLTLKTESKKIKGTVIEAGCALGGSAILITASKSDSRKLNIYDVFAQIPPPTSKDGKDVHERYEIISSGKSEGLGGKKYYGYEENLYQKVLENFENYGLNAFKNNVTFIKGLLYNTLIINEPVSLAHIDVDWYEPVFISLQRIEPWLSTGGSFVIDDYFDWSGCKDAVDDYFADKQKNYYFDSSAGSLVATKIKG